MPFSKKACGWRRIHSRTVWMTASCPLKFTKDSNNSMEKSVSHGHVCLSGVSASERAESAWRMNRMVVGQRHTRVQVVGCFTFVTYQDCCRCSWAGTREFPCSALEYQHSRLPLTHLFRVAMPVAVSGTLGTKCDLAHPPRALSSVPPESPPDSTLDTRSADPGCKTVQYISIH